MYKRVKQGALEKKKQMKDNFVIKKISISRAKPFLKKYHYLNSRSNGFLAKVVYGLFEKDTNTDGLFIEDRLVGIASYSGPGAWEVLKGMLGLDKNADQSKFFELSRLCLLPKIQAREHNLAGWFLSRTLKLLKREFDAKLVLSYADTDFHLGIVYQATNFKYYGLTRQKNDFYVCLANGKYKKRGRGSPKNVKGEWRPRSRKHRYLYIFDKKLDILWKEVPYPKVKNNTL